MSNKRLPTMKDVASTAGVSLGTVSKVFNGIPVGEEYRARVESAAKKLGYQVNIYARGLRASKTNTIAVIVPDVINPFFAELANECSRQLGAIGYRMLLATTSYDPKAEQQCIDMVAQNKVDGIIAITYNPQLEVKDDLPFVIIDRKFNSNVPCVSSDNYTGGCLAAEMLSRKGANKLLFLGVSSHVSGEADKRSIGFENYCRVHGIDCTIYRAWDEDGMDAIIKYIKDSIQNGAFLYDGIFCGTDKVAVYTINYLTSLGIRIPKDVQVIGYDGIQRFGGEGYWCSTIRQPLEQMAAAAIDILINPDRAGSPALVCLPVTFCEGGTTR